MELLAVTLVLVTVVWGLFCFRQRIRPPWPYWGLALGSLVAVLFSAELRTMGYEVATVSLAGSAVRPRYTGEHELPHDAQHEMLVTYALVAPSGRFERTGKFPPSGQVCLEISRGIFSGRVEGSDVPPERCGMPNAALKQNLPHSEREVLKEIERLRD